MSQYSKDGDFIKHFKSLKEASDSVKCNQTSISRAAKEKRLGMNYYWILDNQNIKIEDITLKP